MASRDNVPRSRVSADDGSAACAAQAASVANIIVIMRSFIMSGALLIVKSPIRQSAVLALRGSLPIRFFNSDTQALTFASGALASDK